jgi:hypothetical protein
MGGRLDVDLYLRDVGVAGSNPVTPTNKIKSLGRPLGAGATTQDSLGTRWGHRTFIGPASNRWLGRTRPSLSMPGCGPRVSIEDESCQNQAVNFCSGQGAPTRLLTVVNGGDQWGRMENVGLPTSWYLDG